MYKRALLATFFTLALAPHTFAGFGDNLQMIASEASPEERALDVHLAPLYRQGCSENYKNRLRHQFAQVGDLETLKKLVKSLDENTQKSFGLGDTIDRAVLALMDIEDAAKRNDMVLNLLPAVAKIPHNSMSLFLSLKALSTVEDANERFRVLDLGHSIFVPGGLYSSPHLVIKTLTEIANETDRKQIVALAPSLFTDKMLGNNRAGVLAELAEIEDSNSRETFVTQAARLLQKSTGAMRAFGIMSALKTLQAVHTPDDFIQQVGKVIEQAQQDKMAYQLTESQVDGRVYELLDNIDTEIDLNFLV